jgi:hypothetical protein
LQGNYPIFRVEILGVSSRQGFEDRLEGVCAVQPCGIDSCSYVRLGLRSPHGAIAIGDFWLDHAGPQLSLRAIIGGVDLARIVAKGQKLVLRTRFGLQLAR